LGGAETVAQRQTVFYGLVQKNVLVTGAKGQLGQQLLQLESRINTPFRFLYTDTDELDITDAGAVHRFVAENHVDYIINCAAYTAVDKAETDEAAACLVNLTGAENLARTGAKIIQISTDYVFDGKASTPYREDAPANPLSVYGRSKLKGEEAIRALAAEWMIIRTSWLYSEYGHNFVKTMLRLMSERDELEIVADQFGSPTYAADLAEMILVILECEEWKSGIYHFANRGETSWFQFAGKIRDLAGITGCRLNPVTTSEYRTVATRPAYSVLDTSKIQSAFHVVIPSWENGLERCIGKLKSR
jgi:dTDP-4-dehydrorhamnose reductase